MSDSIHIRNAKALDARGKQLTAEVDSLKQRLQHVEVQFAMMRGELVHLQQQYMMLLTARGSGPTQRD